VAVRCAAAGFTVFTGTDAASAAADQRVMQKERKNRAANKVTRADDHEFTSVDYRQVGVRCRDATRTDNNASQQIKCV